MRAMTVRLYCFGESGNAYKAALALELAGMEWEPVFVDFFHGAHRQPDYLTINPLGEVPVMVADGLTLSQSGAIQQWVVNRTGRFGGRNEAEELEILRFVLFDNNKVSGQAGPLRFNLHFLPADKRNEGANQWLAMRLGAALKRLDAHLEGRDWLVGDGPTMADLSCCGYLFYPEPFGFERSDYMNIDRWLSTISAIPGWKHPYDLMPGRPSDRGL